MHKGLLIRLFLERPPLCQTFSPHIRSHNINGRNLQLGNQKQRWNVSKNCIAILPDGEEPIVVHVHVKRFSDSDRSIGFIEPNSGKFFMFGNASDGLEQLVPTRAVDPSMAADWPYFVVFNTTAGEIICFLPNLNISRVSVYDIETFNKTN